MERCWTLVATPIIIVVSGFVEKVLTLAIRMDASSRLNIWLRPRFLVESEGQTRQL
jgi:hypothetical protein